MPATEEEVTKLLRTSAPKTCELDPIPSQLLKGCESAIVPALTHVINQSLADGMPIPMKEALVTPIPQKPHLDPENLKELQTNIQSVLRFEAD